ncbi:MAG: BspA family leucine-rich repeat surface protein, partial [Flavobacteriales bacterium]|nr:BspA family leucine-rich repeat surface protein [Flavobacteriales bacterium]
MKKLLIALSLFFMMGSCFAQGFITTWQTDNIGASANNQVTIPTFPGETYNYTVQWGDGSQDNNVTGDITHTYPNAGTFTITITGQFPRMYVNDGGDRLKILSVDQWGSNTWTSMEEAFDGCSNLNVLASDAPDLSLCSSTASMFKGCLNMDFDPSSWDMSNVQVMASMFLDCFVFNGDVSSWDVSSATTMLNMFRSNFYFNQNLSSWDTGNVAYMFGMFANCTAFDQNLANWDISNVQTMDFMFDNSGLSDFNYNATLIG